MAGRRVHLVSLGCPKNRVDSEVMAGLLRADGHRLVDDPAEADTIVVNTCAFIEPATSESVDTILELAQHKDHGDCQDLVVTGCLVQRYAGELEVELPEVDRFLGTGEYHRIAEVLRQGSGPRTLVGTPAYIHDETTPRVHSWSTHSAYLKVSEGCDHRCAYCIIPALRGRHRSRTIPSLVAEAARLAAEGVIELNLIGQDTTAYGRDLAGDEGIVDLLRAVGEVRGLEWIRLLYAYPRELPDGLLELLADHPRVCPYVDLPLQHASDRVLGIMRRSVTRARQDRLLERLRARIPDVAIRTTLIVGHPGEGEEDFEQLLAWVGEQRFDHLGVFTYSAEEGTAAATLPDQVPAELAAERQARVMELQARISRESLRGWVGRTTTVLVEPPDSPLVLRGRTARQAPEVDGQVYIVDAPSDVEVGQLRTLRVTDSGDYDLVGEILSDPGGEDGWTAGHGGEVPCLGD